MPPDEPLILNKNVGTHLRNMFNDLEKDQALRDSFLKEPFTVMTRYGITNEASMRVPVNTANKIFFSILSNKKLMDWANSYGKKLVQRHGTTIDPLSIKNEIYRDVVNEIAHSMDTELRSIFESAARDASVDPSAFERTMAEGQPIPASAQRMLPGVALILIVVIAIAFVAVAVDAHDLRASGFDIATRRDLGAVADTINKGFEEEVKKHRVE